MAALRNMVFLAVGAVFATAPLEPYALATPSATTTDLRIVVKKSERKLSLYAGEKLVRTYPVALGPHSAGTKAREGDGATPEGDYFVTHANARSQFHLSLGISYPNATDAARGLSQGLISQSEYAAIVLAIARKERPPQHTRLGGDIFVHGGGLEGDWTKGCIALENKDIEELFANVPPRTPVRILP